MHAQASLGLWEILFWIFTGSGLLGLPPGERDPALLKSVPPQTFLYFEWASRGEGRTGATGIDGFIADPEVRQFIELLDATLAKHEGVANDDNDETGSFPELRPMLPQLLKRLTAQPGCLFAGFEPLPQKKPGVAAWLGMLAGVHGGVILSSGDRTEALWQSLNQALSSVPGFKFDETSTTQSIPVAVPGYSLVLHREGPRIVFALGHGTLSRVVEGLSGRLPGLESNPRFRQAFDRVAVDRVATVGWVDGKGIATSITEALGPLGVLIKPILSMVGVDAVDHVVQASGLDKDAMIQRTFIATGGRTDGAMVLLAGSPIRPQQFAHIPDDADLVLATSLSLTRIFQESRQLLAKAQPLSVRVFDEAIKQLETELELKIVDDVFPAFGDTIIAFDSPSAGGMVVTSLVVSLEVRDAAKAARVFDRLMKFVEQSFSSDHLEPAYGESVSLRRQQFLDRTICYVNTTGSGDRGHLPMTPTFCLTERHLLFAVHPQAMKAQLRHLQSKRPGFDQQANRKVTLPAGETLSYAYLNGPRASNIAGTLLPYLGQTLLSRLEEEGLALDAYSIPSAAAISPYFGDSTAVVSRQRDGLLMEARNAPPVIVGLGLLSIYRAWNASGFESLEAVRRHNADGADRALLGPAENDIVPALAETKGAASEPAKDSPSPYRKFAPIFLKALIPDGVQQLIPESTFRQLEEGPSAATIQRREDARKKREERRRRRLEPVP